ncbi:AGAP007781-PA-like protein [Anopheles sinensis]|uniref:AGAP007781-PA-like protein n=1 Tax=Anopheles sinensis TaxID=74873 RepID=A0A084W7H7_ANOSI|nr:AGAP007781-PA-like protein [Anopheles sinensis]
MSASPIARQACASITQAIPSKRVLIHDASELPDLYSSTPGGTLYSTTPGGKFPGKRNGK